MAAPASYRFGPYYLDRAAYRLLDGDRSIELSPKAIDLLLLLVERAGSLVTKDDILKAVWPDVAVTDNALTQVVSDLRHALGDSSTTPRYVETVPRRGYRFIAPVEPAASGSPARAGAAPAASRPKTIAVRKRGKSAAATSRRTMSRASSESSGSSCTADRATSICSTPSPISPNLPASRSPTASAW